MNCPRCGTRFPGPGSECGSCGLPKAFVDQDDGLVGAIGEEAVEPEVLESLDEAERTRFTANPAMGPLGCTLGPWYGCAGLPVAVLGAVVVSSLMALLWVLSLGRVPFSLAGLIRRAGRGSRKV